MGGKLGPGEKEEWGILTVHRLHKSELGVTERQIPAPQDGPHTVESGRGIEDVHAKQFLGLQLDRGALED